MNYTFISSIYTEASSGSFVHQYVSKYRLQASHYSQTCTQEHSWHKLQEARRGLKTSDQHAGSPTDTTTTFCHGSTASSLFCQCIAASSIAIMHCRCLTHMLPYFSLLDFYIPLLNSFFSLPSFLPFSLPCGGQFTTYIAFWLLSGFSV